MGCPSHEELQALLVDDLPEPRQQRLQTHVDECPSCQTTLDHLGGQEDLLEDMRALLPRDQVEPAEPLPEAVGPFRILDVVGRGGMGVVYRAQQEHPHRLVALKVMHPSIMGRSSMRRFELEVDVLGQLDHVGIARIYAAGTARVFTENQPWFAMELIDGQRLDHCVRERGLDLDARLRLFLETCEAIRYAHQRGVIHRDLKPGNILVDQEGRPKVIDFGLARATDADLVQGSLHTEQGDVLGTLPYMAPEQLGGAPETIDTRADVYGLGAVLYELVCGRPPLLLSGEPLIQAAQRIAEEPPPRPSSLRENTPRELDWILARALAKRPEERYGSVAELQADIQRFLDSEPLEAGPPGPIYRLRLFARRHRIGVSVAVLALVAVGTGVGLTIHALLESRRVARVEAEAHDATRVAEAQARARAEEIQRVAEFVLGMFTLETEEIQDCIEGFSNARPSMERLLDHVTPRVEAEFPDLPVQRAALYQSLGQAWSALEDDAAARECLERSLEVRLTEFGRLHPETLSSLQALGAQALQEDDPAEAAVHLREALAGREALLAADDPELMRTVDLLSQAITMLALERRGDLAEAEGMLRRYLSMAQRAHGGDHPDVFYALRSLGVCLVARERYAEAEALLEEALVMCERVLTERSRSAAAIHHELGSANWWLRNLEAARCHYEVAARTFEALSGPEDPYTIRSLHQLGTALMDVALIHDAFDVSVRAWHASRNVPEGQEPLVDSYRDSLVNQVMTLRDMTFMNMRNEVRTLERTAGPDAPPTVALRQRLLARSLDLDLLDAPHMRLLEETLGSHQRRLGMTHPDTLRVLAHYARLFEGTDDPERRQGVLDLINQLTPGCLDAATPELAPALAELARVLEGYRWPDLALPFRRAANLHDEG